MAMNMRSRGAANAGNRSRHGVRPIYEDYKPLCEWKHEDTADILLYHLPGFVKDQIRILAESKGILRVHGQRLIGGNKWSRFQDEFSVAEDCNMSGIRAKFEGGILQIIMPKKIVNPPITHDRTPQSSAPHHHHHQQEHDHHQQERDHHQQERDQHEHERDHQQHEHESIPNPDHNLQAKRQHLEENTSTSVSMKAGAQMEEESKHKENNTSLLDDEDELVPKAMENKQRNKVNYEEYKRGIKGQVPRWLDEDRQLLVNMGVAVLVIVGLGAYITQSFASSI